MTQQIVVGLAGSGDTADQISGVLAEHGMTIGSRAETAAELLEAGGVYDVAVVSCADRAFDGVRELCAVTLVVAVLPDSRGFVARKALRAGVGGIVLQEHVELALIPTLYGVRAGQVVVPGEARQQVDRPVLSTREKQVLGMVVLGLTNQEIAGRLYLTESTVKAHLSSAFGKLGVRSRHEAAAVIMDPDQALGPSILHITDAGAPGMRDAAAE